MKFRFTDISSNSYTIRFGKFLQACYNKPFAVMRIYVTLNIHYHLKHYIL